MVLILDGNSEQGAHVLKENGNFICLDRQKYTYFPLQVRNVV